MKCQISITSYWFLLMRGIKSAKLNNLYAKLINHRIYSSHLSYHRLCQLLITKTWICLSSSKPHVEIINCAHTDGTNTALMLSKLGLQPFTCGKLIQTFTEENFMSSRTIRLSASVDRVSQENLAWLEIFHISLLISVIFYSFIVFRRGHVIACEACFTNTCLVTRLTL